MPTVRGLNPEEPFNKWYGGKIRQLRDRNGWTQADLGDKVFLSRSRIAQFEGGEAPPFDVAERLDEALGANTFLSDLWCRLERRGADWRSAPAVLDMERNARKIKYYMSVIPALLQTREYATALLSAGMPFYGGNLDDKVNFRLGRQAVLESTNPPWIWAVLDESALYRSLGQPDTLRDQLVHLLKATEAPNINVQILLHDQATLFPAIGLTTIFELRDGRTVLCREGVEESAFTSNEKTVAPFATLYDHLQSEALSPTQSMAFVRKVIEERHS
ncbi:transcriptional regulator [Streptomyces mashuensis]|uniref:Transcriptional regulator n=1 Tax=Streptomyces mashuensis TaxID=33904 RepID=A0A919AUW4_9ACTN|nr:helix-turn-helix transcriptional regulator [Streptomyces mashuensis]GHF26775.1 transcriptional regulator [Streptomyces mashuensis]